MRHIIVILACGIAAFGTNALAQGFDYGPNTSLYLSYAFDRPANQADTPALNFGMRLDHDWRQQVAEVSQPLVEWQFDTTGFEHIRINGTPLVNRDLVLRQDGESGGVLDYLKRNLGTVALVVSGAVLLYMVVDGATEDDDDGGADFPRDNIDCDGADRPDECRGP